MHIYNFTSRIKYSKLSEINQAEEFYNSQKEKLLKQLHKLSSRKSAFGILRFGNVILIIAAVWYLSTFGWLYAVAGAILLLFIFVRLVYADLRNRELIEHTKKLLTIQEEELLALEGKYFQFKGGDLLKPADHFYANDLDIIGHASLLQYVNRTMSGQGIRKLTNWLLSPASKEEIPERQTAVKELLHKNEWRQNFQATGRQTHIEEATEKSIENWLKEKDIFLQFKPWSWLRYLLPLIICSIVVLVIFGFFSMSILYLSLLIFSLIAYQINKLVAPVHVQLGKTANELSVLSQLLKYIENEKFETTLLQKLQSQLQTKEGTASGKIKNLSSILDRLDIRYNLVISAPLNILLLWNLQQVLDLEKWKKRNREVIKNWFDAMANFESLHSFASLSFNHSGWCWPALSDKYFHVAAKEMGHPLINKNKRVNNDIEIDEAGKIMLVTGSNMGGKSTYLRSIGVNAVLALAGAPVCARAFSISRVQILSSMRVADNLEESTSTFYAELKKLKTIIDKVNEQEKVFILLDEILRGTNSHDRHTGSVALVKQFIHEKTAAVLATHDLQLAEIANQFPENILNFHFDVQVQNEELFFDYKLKKGICTSMNASILMKKIGIDII